MPALSQSLEFTYNNTTSVAVVYPNTATTMLTYTSTKAKGDGYYGSSDGFHTVAYTANTDFVGTITMQATLATDPADSDWFNVTGTTTTYTALNIRSTSTVDCHNFTGNFVWVRGQVRIEDGIVEVIHYNH
jgi:hypothetical protein